MPAHIEDCRNNQEKPYGIFRDDNDGHLKIYIKDDVNLPSLDKEATGLTSKHLVNGTLIEVELLGGATTYAEINRNIDLEEVYRIKKIAEFRDLYFQLSYATRDIMTKQ